MEPTENHKLYMQGSGDKPQRETPQPPPPSPPQEPPSPPSEPDRRDYTKDSPLPDAIEPEKDWDRK